MTNSTKKQIETMVKDMWFNICVLERDYGIEYDGYMTNILKFTLQCIANKYGLDIGIRKDIIDGKKPN